MSSGVSRNKDKGLKLSNEKNTSFVKNVTSRVSGLIPSTITKWFSGPSSSNANGSAPPAAESTDSSTEDETAENSLSSQPLAKRKRFNTPVKTTQYTPIVTKCSSTNTESMEPSNVVLSPPGSNTFRRETNYVSTPIQSRIIEASTTGNDSGISVYNLCGSVSNTINNSIDRKRKSLFVKSTNDVIKSIDKSPVSTAKNLNYPYFKSSLLGSPFYPGRTMYGGAASSYMNQPNIKHRKDTLVNESSNNNSITMSNSAKRVMDLLENYSSPLVEAKRIPQSVQSPKKSSLNSSMEFSPNLRSSSYKTQELHVPRIATILRLKQKSRLMDTTNLARQIIASHSSSSEYSPYPTGHSNIQSESVEKMTTKIKTRITRTNRGGSEIESVNPISLPEATLQIDYDNLPQFSFDTPGSSNTLTRSTLKTVSNNPQTDNKDLSKSDNITPDDKIYTFSSPVKICNEISLVSNTLPKFTFGSPERMLEKDAENKIPEKKNDNTGPISVSTCSKKTIKELYNKQNNNEVPGENSTDSINIKDKSTDCDKKTNGSNDLSVTLSLDTAKWKCDDCWVNNDANSNKCVCCGSIKSKKVSGDKGIQNSIVVDKSIDSLLKWKCPDCWVSNDTGSEKCMCCGCNKVNKVSSHKEQQNIINVIKDKENNDIDWKCDNCWIKNKMSANKCAACGNKKPGYKTSKSSNYLQVTNDIKVTSTITEYSDSLKKIVEAQTNMWECPICLVKNENNRSKCVCCEAEKPGNKNELEKKAFSIGSTTSGAFKFGIDPKKYMAESKTSDEAKTKENDLPKEAETNNNVLPKVTSFTFGIPAKKLEDKKTTEENKQQEPSKIKFAFGVPKLNPQQNEVTKEVQKSQTSPLLAKPAEDTNKSINKDDKQSSVPSIGMFSSGFLAAPKVQSNLFVAPFTTQLSDQKAIQDTPTSSANENAETTGTSISATNETGVETKVTKSNFTFVPSANLFSSPISTISTTRPSFTTQQATLPSINVSPFEKSEANPIPLIKNNESINTSLLFNQKRDVVSTTSQSFLLPAASIFNFGNTQQTAVTQADKQQFRFSFQNNKTETNLFPNAFGNTTDSNQNAHNFTLPVTSGLGSSGTQPGPSLGISNVLTAGNATPNNLLSGGNSLGTGNAIGSNDLGSNAINTTNSLSTSTTLPGIPASGMFSTPGQKENLWSAKSNVTTNLFVTNANTLQKPTFTFGATTNFNATTPNSAFGAGASGTSVAAGQQSTNVFAMAKQNNNSQPQPPMFSNPIQSPPASSNLFRAPSLANNTTPSMGMFSTPNLGGTSTFGTPNQSIPGFEAPITQAPAFNFGTSSTPVFGFPQQQPHLQQQPQAQQQPQQQQQPQTQPGSLYSFGAATGNSQPVQFNMGSAPNSSVRRVRKAIRRTTQR